MDKSRATLSFTFTFPLTSTFPLFPFPLSFSLHVEHVERDVLHFPRAPPLVLPIYALTDHFYANHHTHSILTRYLVVKLKDIPKLKCVGHILNCCAFVFRVWRQFKLL